MKKDGKPYVKMLLSESVCVCVCVCVSHRYLMFFIWICDVPAAVRDFQIVVLI